MGKRDRSEKKEWLEDSVMTLDQRDSVDARTIVNAAFTIKDLMIEKMDIQLSGYNLLDEDHRDPDVTLNLLNDIPRAGRTFLAKVHYTF